MCTLSAKVLLVTTHMLHKVYTILIKSNKNQQEIKMKNLVFTALMGLAMVGFTGCTNSSDAEVAKCQSGKCQSAKKCDGSKKCEASGKCGDAKKAKKCAASGKCGK